MVNIAIFAPNKSFYGHLILQIPFLHHLKLKHPESKITIYSTVSQVSLFKNLGFCDEIFIYKKGGANFGLVTQMLRQKPAVIYNLRPYSAYIQLIIGLFYKAYKVGFSSGLGSKLIYNKVRDYNSTIYKSCLYLSLLDKQFAEDSFAYFDQFKETLPFKETNIFTFMPGGGEGEHKKWGIHNFLSLSASILKDIPDSRIVFILGPMEKEEAQLIKESNLVDKFTVYISPEISTIASITKNSVVVVANDCGPSHIAQMMDCNYIGVWGWEKQRPIIRIAEWSYTSEKSLQIVAKYGMSIKTISSKRVLRSIKSILSERTFE
jgi:ADP-heptose:LPS heptosyltransferase